VQRVSILLVMLGACYSDLADDDGGDPNCPATETCSNTINHLDFIGETIANDPFASGPLTTAVGGTQDIRVEYELDGQKPVPLDVAFTADDNGGPSVVVDNTVGATVTVRGIAAGANFLRILDARDGTLFGRDVLVAAEIDSIALLSADFEVPPSGEALAFASGDRRVGVALSAASGNRLVDTSMLLAMDGASRVEWDTALLAGATAGTHTLVVTAGDRSPSTLDVVIVDSADAIEAIDLPATIPAGALALLCFAARNAGRFVAGFSDWSVLTDNGEINASLSPNCFMLQGTAAGPVNLTVHAGGMTMPFTLTAEKQP